MGVLKNARKELREYSGGRISPVYRSGHLAGLEDVPEETPWDQEQVEFMIKAGHLVQRRVEIHD